MSQNRLSIGRLVDWRAAVIAGLIAGTIFLILNLLLIPEIIGGTTEMVFRYFASIPLGESALSPDRSFGGGIMIAAILLHYFLSILFALIVAFILHRWGVIMGALGGAVLGIVIYFINFYSLTYFFPWFFALSGGLFLTIHAIFGATVGTLYEVIERDKIEGLQGENQPSI